VLSVVVPVYNEGENIAEFLAELARRALPPYEVLIVHDRDDDDTLPVLAALKAADHGAFKHVRPVKNSVHRGPSGALRSGFAAAAGEHVLVAMADLSDDLSQVEALRDAARRGYAVVCPSRYCPGGEQRLNSIRATIPRWASLTLRALTGIPTHDATNSFRLYSRALLASLELTSTHSFSVTLEILAKAYWRDAAILEIPTVWNDRRHGVSKFPFVASLATYLPWFFLATAKGLLNRLGFGRPRG